MRFMLLFKGDVTEINNTTPSAAFIEEMLRFTDQLKQAGVLISYEGLVPSNAGSRVETRGQRKDVVTGPFKPETEQIAGFYLIDVKSKDEALDWAKRVPVQDGPASVGANATGLTGSTVEVRQVMETQSLPAITEQTRSMDQQIRHGLPTA